MLNDMPLFASPRPGDEPLSREEESVLKVLSSHRGRENAIKAPRLAREAGVTPRQLRELLGHLIEFHGIRIGSTTSPPYGYYLIEDYEDAEEAIEHLRHKAMSILRRMAVLKRMVVADVLGQLRLNYISGDSPHRRDAENTGGGN